MHKTEPSDISHVFENDGPVDICVITTIHTHFDARVYDRELRTLVEAGYRVTFICPWRKPDHPSIQHNWITFPYPVQRKDRILHGWRVFQATLKVDAEVYQFHDLDFILWALILRLVKKRPFIYDCHENYPEEIRHNKPWIPKSLRPLLSGVVRMLENGATRILGQAIVTVPSLENRFTALGARVVQVRNLSRWSAHRDLPHQHAIICTGGLSESYGLFVLLGIARELKARGRDIPLILVDRFYTERLRETFMDAIESEGLNVVIHPNVSPNEMDVLLSKGCIALATEQNSPEKRIALPTKIFEYMAMGLPMVTSDVPLTKMVMEQIQCGYVVPAGDSGAYVDAILRIWDSPELMEVFRERGFRAIETEFNWEHEGEKLLKFISPLVTSKSRLREGREEA